MRLGQQDQVALVGVTREVEPRGSPWADPLQGRCTVALGVSQNPRQVPDFLASILLPLLPTACPFQSVVGRWTRSVGTMIMTMIHYTRVREQHNSSRGHGVLHEVTMRRRGRRSASVPDPLQRHLSCNRHGGTPGVDCLSFRGQF